MGPHAEMDSGRMVLEPGIPETEPLELRPFKPGPILKTETRMLSCPLSAAVAALGSCQSGGDEVYCSRKGNCCFKNCTPDKKGGKSGSENQAKGYRRPHSGEEDRFIFSLSSAHGAERWGLPCPSMTPGTFTEGRSNLPLPLACR